MSGALIGSRVARVTQRVLINQVHKRHMPVNVPPTATGKRRFRLAVETDPHKLVNYCCGLNYHVDEPPVKLKPDEDYPDWLWTLRLGPKPKSWELEKGTKEYYKALADEGEERERLLRMRQSKVKKVVGKHLIEKEEYQHRLRFATLAHLEEDAGLDAQSLEIDWWHSPAKVNKSDFYLPLSKDKVLYKDKIVGTTDIGNYHKDDLNSFKTGQRVPRKRASIIRPAIQDSRRRHRYSVF